MSDARIVNKRMNKTGVGDDDPAAIDPLKPQAPPLPDPPAQGDLF